MPYRKALEAVWGTICFLGGLVAIWALIMFWWALQAPMPQ